MVVKPTDDNMHRFRILCLSWQGWQQRLQSNYFQSAFTTVQDAVCGTASATALLKVEGNIGVMIHVV